jgi:16S rRNA (guanine527-N7)-methyltransferase
VSSARGLLDRGLAELGLSLSDPQVSQLLELANLVDAWGQRINLTGHRGLHAILHRLVLDAAALLAALPAIESLADLGSGAGFPGLPAAILRPECRVTLVESREKRHHFQRAACRSLQLENAIPIRGRVEALAPTLHEAVVTQAMAKPPEALALAERWARPGGLILIPAGVDPPDPLESESVSRERVVRYRVPCGGPSRLLWIGRKLL